MYWSRHYHGVPLLNHIPRKREKNDMIVKWTVVFSAA